jgi:uncharacterized protein YbbC (DUF1343 family)
VFFEPTFQKHAKITCGGCQIHVLDRRSFLPVRTALEMLDEFRSQDPAKFAWREPPYEYEHEKMPIDILYGSSVLREAVENGGITPLVASAARESECFLKTRETFLLY